MVKHSPFPPAQAVDGAHDGRVGFELNRGQTDERITYLARGAGYTLFLYENEAVFALRYPVLKPSGAGSSVFAGVATGGLNRVETGSPRAAVVTMKLVGANPSPLLQGVEQIPGTVNYLKGRDPGKWIADVPAFAKVRYGNVYPGVDLVYYRTQRNLEYDFIVAPGAEPSVVTLAFEGAETLQVDARGDLVLRTAGGELRQQKPLAHQDTERGRQAVDARYVITEGNRIGFDVGVYDKTRPLVIDPLLVYSTYLGGSADDEGVAVAVDGQGNVYVTGTTTSSDFPTTPGVDAERGGDSDMFVTKFDATGARVYSTYLGDCADDASTDIAVDAGGNVYITGQANQGMCSNPSQFPRPGAFVAKLNPAGRLAPGGYFFIFGGSYDSDSLGQGIAVDTLGHAYVAGTTSSADFPTTSHAFRRTPCSGIWLDGFVAKVNAAGSDFVYSTFLCGSERDAAIAIAVDAVGHAYVAGSTVSKDFPTRNAFQPNHRSVLLGDANGFITKLTPDGSDLVFSTYLGGTSSDVLEDLALDAAGNAYVTGWGRSQDFPTTTGVVQASVGLRPCLGICTAALMAKFNPTGARVYSTYLYGEDNDEAASIAVDSAGNAYVTGITHSRYFPIVNAFQPRAAAGPGWSDAFVTKLNPSASALVYSSYLGGGGPGTNLEGEDEPKSIAVDSSGNAVVVGFTRSYSFPTRNAWQPNLRRGICGISGVVCADAFVTKIAAAGTGVTPAVRISASPGIVAVGGTVTATWAGLPAPTASDRLQINPLGSVDADAVGSRATTAAASGSLPLALPAKAGLGWYELRLLTPDPAQSGTHVVVARSAPFKVSQMHPPNAPTQLRQFKADGSTALAVGATTDQTTVVVKLTMSDPDDPDTLTPEIEIKPLTTAFTATGLVAGGGVSYAGSARQGVVTATGLPAGTYHWRARVRDAAGLVGPWVSFGGNSETAADVRVVSSRVSVTATDGTATEAGRTTGTLKVTRTGGSNAAALTVYYTLGGTATAGTDYAVSPSSALPRRVTIPAGQASALITVTPVDDTVMEVNETVVATLTANPTTPGAYTIGSPRSATLAIVSNE